MKKLTKKQQLRNKVNKATEMFLNQGGKIKKIKASTEVKMASCFDSFADFMLMDNQQFKAV